MMKVLRSEIARPKTAKGPAAKPGPKAAHAEDIVPELALVQIVARELADGRVRGSLTQLSKLTGISLDSLRVLKRSESAPGSRKLAAPRVRLLAILVAAHRLELLAKITDEAIDIEREWRERYGKQLI
jgi:hypothetical protein